MPACELQMRRAHDLHVLIMLLCCGICTPRLSAPRVTTGKDLDDTNFDKEVLRDDQVWLVEIGSKMCGSCKQFEPTWQEVKERMKRINTGQVNIDEPNGMKIAQKLGALEKGIPHVMLFHLGGVSKGKTLLAGEIKAAKFIQTAVRDMLTEHHIDEDGIYVKLNGEL